MSAAERDAAAANWRTVTDEELKLTAADIGDPEADAAILFREGLLDDTLPDGTTLRMYIRIKIFNQRGRRFADVQLPYRLDLGRIGDVSARTIRPDGSSLDVQARDIFDQLTLRTRRGVWRAKVFSMPAVEPGSIIEYRYRQAYPAGFRYFQLDLQSELFTRKLHYEIQPLFGSRLDVRWVAFNVGDSKRFQPVWNGAFNIRAENIEPFRREPSMPPELGVKMWGWLYYTSQPEINPDKYWRDYARRMYDGAEEATRPTRLLRRTVDAITAAAGPSEISSADDSDRKIGRIYDYVQNQIHNIGELTDRETLDTEVDLKKNERVDDTLRRRYGTPHDINRLFVAMLRAAKFDARVVELTTRDENFFHRSFPDAFQFSGEVAAIVQRDGGLRFYDVGTPFCPRGMLAWEKEGVTALVYGGRDWRFVQTPVSDATASLTERHIDASLSPDGELKARVAVRMTGQRALEFRGEAPESGTGERRKRIAKEIRGLLPAATIDDAAVTVSDAQSSAAPVTTTCAFTVPAFATRTEKRMLLRPARLSHADDGQFAAAHRTSSIYFDFPWSESERVVIQIPEGYESEVLPDPVNIDIGAARYSASFAREGNRVIYERRLVVNGINFNAEHYGTLREFFNRVLQADHAAVSFKQQ